MRNCTVLGMEEQERDVDGVKFAIYYYVLPPTFFSLFRFFACTVKPVMHKPMFEKIVKYLNE